MCILIMLHVRVSCCIIFLFFDFSIDLESTVEQADVFR